eukprot:TRINITY_DN91231_c0_g1_i1.p1 TRINITY_DN91231_c0_g1~~TRINITY_DN91231_c0_g1_i1.p1  ORF type:complete len:455 (-),score=84.30 TRINITY_DN91231_c0_g1_i1:159-1391(-)
MTLASIKDDAWAQDDLDGRGSLQHPDWQALYMQFQRRHVLGTVPYRWDSRVRDYREAQLIKAAFEDVQVVSLEGELFHDISVSAEEKALAAKSVLQIKDGLLMETLGQMGKVALVRETQFEVELLVPHCLLPRMKFKEQVLVRWRRHLHLPVTDKWCEVSQATEWKSWREGLEPDGIVDLPQVGEAVTNKNEAPHEDGCAEQDKSCSCPQQLLQSDVPGLVLAVNFLNEEQEATLIAAIDESAWMYNRAQTRRVQMYGVKHDAQYRVCAKAPVTPLPPFAHGLVNKIHDYVTEHFPNHVRYMFKLGASKVTELFVNEYSAGSSLQFHTDHNVTYEEMIVGISLGADSLLRFQECEREDNERVVRLPQRSAYFMTGPSRTDYKHGIREGDVLGLRRVSLTFRVVRESAIIK